MKPTKRTWETVIRFLFFFQEYLVLEVGGKLITFSSPV